MNQETPSPSSSVPEPLREESSRMNSAVQAVSDSSTYSLQDTSAVWHPFDPRQIDYDRFVGWIVLLVVAGILLVACCITLAANWPRLMVPGIVALVGICVLIALAVGNIYLPPLSYKRSAWLCDDRGFQVRKGIWFRKVTSVPRARVQHTDVHQGPVARSYGLAKLTIHTAGTANSSIEVEGLSLEVASKLRDALIEDRSFEDAV